MKSKFFFLFFFISASTFAQNIFPANDISLISGKELILRPLTNPIMGYQGFYRDEKLRLEKELDYTNYDVLVNQVFKVVSITQFNYLDNVFHYKIKLNNSKIGNIYYDYDPKREEEWHFEIVGKVDLPNDFYCRGLQLEADKFTGDTTYSTDATDGIILSKTKKGNSVRTYFSINVHGNTISVGQRGLILLLENGKRIEKPDLEIQVTAGYSSGYVYNAFLELTKKDIELLTENEITDARLFIYDDTIKNGKRIMEFLKCLIQK